MSGRKAALWGVALASVILMAVGMWRVEARWHPIRYVRIQGEVEHLTLEELRKVLQPVLGGYWAVDLERAAAAVETLAWVDRVVIQRIWPDVLVLNVREQVPLVRWGEGALLNRRGEMFVPRSLAGYQDLALLRGPDNYQQRMFRDYVRWQKMLAPLAMRIERLEVDSRRSWRLQMEGGMIIRLGRPAPEATFERLIRALNRLGVDRCQQIQWLDGRYEHGFAIRWRKEGQGRDGKTLMLERHG